MGGEVQPIVEKERRSPVNKTATKKRNGTAAVFAATLVVVGFITTINLSGCGNTTTVVAANSDSAQSNGTEGATCTYDGKKPCATGFLCDAWKKCVRIPIGTTPTYDAGIPPTPKHDTGAPKFDSGVNTDTGKPVGSEGTPCYFGSCLTGLTCLSNVCVKMQTSDSGVKPDSGKNPGTEGAVCIKPGDLCFPGLNCLSNVCVKMQTTDSGPKPEAGKIPGTEGGLCVQPGNLCLTGLSCLSGFCVKLPPTTDSGVK
ncbi:hypothetical protein EPN28_01280, partial [Patescibacteria group bacterium]